MGEWVSKSEKIKEHKFMRTTFHIKSATNHIWFQGMETKLVDLIREIRLAGIKLSFLIIKLRKNF